MHHQFQNALTPLLILTIVFGGWFLMDIQQYPRDSLASKDIASSDSLFTVPADVDNGDQRPHGEVTNNVGEGVKGALNVGVPSPPIVTGQVYSSFAIKLYWRGASDKDGTVIRYEIYRNGVKRHTSSNSSWWQADLSADTAYTYKIVAIDNDGKRSAVSNELTLRTRPQ